MLIAAATPAAALLNCCQLLTLQVADLLCNSNSNWNCICPFKMAVLIVMQLLVELAIKRCASERQACRPLTVAACYTADHPYRATPIILCALSPAGGSNPAGRHELC
jgi:hypothetical protein